MRASYDSFNHMNLMILSLINKELQQLLTTWSILDAEHFLPSSALFVVMPRDQSHYEVQNPSCTILLSSCEICTESLNRLNDALYLTHYWQFDKIKWMFWRIEIVIIYQSRQRNTQNNKAARLYETKLQTLGNLLSACFLSILLIRCSYGCAVQRRFNVGIPQCAS